MEQLYLIILVGGIVFVTVLIILFAVGYQPLMRAIIKSSGTPARARILEQKVGKWVMTNGSNYNQSISRQQITLKLEVHPTDAMPYICEDRFMAKPEEMMRLTPGCDVQVMISQNNPQRVVCLPETVTASADAPADSRANVALAGIVEQAMHGTAPTSEDVLEALKSRGFQTTIITSNFGSLTPDQQRKVEDALKLVGQNPGMAHIVDIKGVKTNVVTHSSDPKETLEKLKQMLDSGLITSQEYEDKKKEILDRM